MFYGVFLENSLERLFPFHCHEFFKFYSPSFEKRSRLFALISFGIAQLSALTYNQSIARLTVKRNALVQQRIFLEVLKIFYVNEMPIFDLKRELFCWHLFLKLDNSCQMLITDCLFWFLVKSYLNVSLISIPCLT